ncbi:MAG: glycosyltransferase family 4 protein [Candidatus Nanopelagicales bacterium]
MRVAHVIAEYSRHEAMGRTVAETASRLDATAAVITARAHDGTEVFDRVYELGGGVETFPARRGAALSGALADFAPDVVHLHGGALAPLLAAGTAIRGHRLVMTMYAWPTLPPPRSLRKAGLRAAGASNVLRPRVLATTVLPPVVAAAALRRAGLSVLLTPDPRVEHKLTPHLDVPIRRLGSGAPATDLRARFDPDSPVVVFAGRAESVRGVDTLIDAFPAVLAAVPGARLRLLLIERPELPTLLEMIRSAGLGDRVEIITETRQDLLADMAAAQVGVWPFKFDYTTSPPAMAVTEALAVGLPVVATRVACVAAALTDGHGGLLVPPMDAPALAAAITALLRDPARWQAQSAAGPVAVRRLSWELTAETTAAAYARAVG